MKISSVLKSPFTIVSDILKLFVIYMPGRTGIRLRYFYYKRKFKQCGKNVIIDVGVQIEGPELISIGDNVHIDKFCILSTGKHLIGDINRKENKAFKFEEGELVIGSNVHLVQFCVIMAFGGVHISDFCTLSAGTKIYSLTNLPYDPKDRSRVVSIMPYEQAPFLCSPVVFEENVWFGLNCIIMPHTHLKKNSFIVSNSLVMGEFPENSYIGGQPAKRIKNRYSI